MVIWYPPPQRRSHRVCLGMILDMHQLNKMPKTWNLILLLQWKGFVRSNSKIYSNQKNPVKVAKTTKTYSNHNFYDHSDSFTITFCHLQHHLSMIVQLFSHPGFPFTSFQQFPAWKLSLPSIHRQAPSSVSQRSSCCSTSLLCRRACTALGGWSCKTGPRDGGRGSKKDAEERIVLLYFSGKWHGRD